MKRSATALAFALVATFGSIPNAAADGECTTSDNYTITVEGNTVVICPVNLQNRACPDPAGMLRRDVNTGEVVKLSQHCQSSCYVDECVPKGWYAYGFAKPYACCSGCCWTPFYASTPVTSELSGSCTRSQGNAAPAAWSDPLPWQGVDVCRTDGGLAGGSDAAAGPGASDAAAGSGNDDRVPGNDDSGCGVRKRTRAIVLGADVTIALLALGIVVLRRRLRRRA